MNRNPYRGLPEASYWRTGIVKQSPLEPKSLYRKKFIISPEDAIAAAGSCFAQHITRNMRARSGFKVMDCEPAPSGIALSEEDMSNYSYKQYTCRYGNLYTVRQFVQLIEEAFENRENPEPVWERDGRFYDAMRPAVEPNGFCSVSEVLSLREEHLLAVQKMVKSMDVLVFTLGLTEAWSNNDGWVFPTAPGTIAGDYNEDRYVFNNFDFEQIKSDMDRLLALLEKYNESSNFRMLLTVSPVPLTATYENEHILLAATYSKSVLRSIAGYYSKKFNFIDYFPSYELITSHWSRGVFFKDNLREVAPEGVSIVMDTFFKEHAEITEEHPTVTSKLKLEELEDGVACEDALLEAFVD